MTTALKRQIIIGGLVLTLVLPSSLAYGEELTREVKGINQYDEDSSQMMTNTPHADVTIYIDGIQQEYEVAPFIENGTTLVPMRSIFEELGAEVKWIEHSKTVIATKKELSVELKIGSYFAKVNDETVKMDTQAKLVNGTTMVPLRFVSTALGAEVEWEAETKTVQITREQSTQPQTETEQSTTELEKEGEATESETTVTGNGDAEDSQTTALTYEEAVSMALARSYKLKVDNENIKKMEEIKDRIAEDFIYSMPEGRGQGYADLMARQQLLGMVQTDIGLGMAKKQVTITEEAIAFQVKDAMDEIISTQKELVYTKLELEHVQKQLELARIKTELGLESEYNLSTAKNTLEEGRKQKEVLLKTLDKAYLKLNQLIGKPDEEHYEITETINFGPIKVPDLDAHVNRSLSIDPYVWLQEQQIAHSQKGLDLYTYNANQDPYKAKESDVRRERNELMDLKDNLDESIRTKYNDILQLEIKYEILEVNLAKAEDALNLVRAQYDAGMAIDLQLEETQLAVEKIKLELTKLAITHQKLTILFYKPYLAPDYLS